MAYTNEDKVLEVINDTPKPMSGIVVPDIAPCRAPNEPCSVEISSIDETRTTTLYINLHSSSVKYFSTEYSPILKQVAC